MLDLFKSFKARLVSLPQTPVRPFSAISLTCVLVLEVNKTEGAFGSLCIKGSGESTLSKDFPIPLMKSVVPSDLESHCTSHIFPKERTLSQLAYCFCKSFLIPMFHLF